MINTKQIDSKTLNMEDTDLIRIQLEKESAMSFRERRHNDWNRNYTLYRDRIITNRLTQRQTINIPLVKYGIQTIMKDIDDSPILYFDNLDNEEQKEIYYNEYWKEMSKVNKIDIRDRIDKKQVCIYGRSFKKLNIKNGRFSFEIVDPQDILIERHVDPADVDSSMCIIQTGIYRPLEEILRNESYDKSELAKLRLYMTSEEGREESEQNLNEYTERYQRLLDMGVTDALDPKVGRDFIELNEVHRKEYDDIKKVAVNYVYIIAVTKNCIYKLCKKKLSEVLGETEDDFWDEHYPFTSWAGDIEATDFWSDGTADILRPIAEALNTWVSQLLENRTLSNFNMHYYDATNTDFIPQTFSPQPWGWYPVPGDPNTLIKDVQVRDLSESLDEIQFIMGIAEKAVAATSTQAGQIEQKQVTLGEVQIAVANAKERVKSMQVFYQESWLDFGLKYIKILEGASNLIDPVKIIRKGRQGKKNYTKIISPKMWMSKSGYKVDIKTKEDKQAEDINMIQKLNAVMQTMPDNMPLKSIYNKKLLDFAGLNADEMKQVLDYEEQKDSASNDTIDQTMQAEQMSPPNQMESNMPAMAQINQ